MPPDASPALRGYTVPRYRAEGAAFYHFLHGTVPGHQIDFMYCPEVPQGALRQTHVGHLARLIKYIEPRDGAPYAFAIGNLSRDDVQHGPGHGGIVVVFALRVPGVVDHAGRDMPPYAHGVVAVDRHLTYGTLLQTTTALYRHFLERQGPEGCGDFYRSYVRKMREEPAEVEELLAKSIADFDDLPSPPRSTLGWDYAVDDGDPPRQIALVYDEPMEFGMLAHRAVALAALLYRSNVKWTSISAGRELAVAGGTTIRFVPRSEVRSGTSERDRSFELEALPDDEESLALLLFGAKRRGAAGPARVESWRQALAAQRAAEGEGESAVTAEVAVDGGGVAAMAGAGRAVDVKDADDAAMSFVDEAAATIPVGSPLEGARQRRMIRRAFVRAPRATAAQSTDEATNAPAVGSTGAGGASPTAPLVLAGATRLGQGYLTSAPEASSAGPAEGERRSVSKGFRGHWIVVAVALAGLAAVIVVAVTAGIDIGMGPAGESGKTSASSRAAASNPGLGEDEANAAAGPGADAGAAAGVRAGAAVRGSESASPGGRSGASGGVGNDAGAGPGGRGTSVGVGAGPGGAATVVGGAAAATGGPRRGRNAGNLQAAPRGESAGPEPSWKTPPPPKPPDF